MLDASVILVVGGQHILHPFVNSVDGSKMQHDIIFEELHIYI